jgi:protein-tyrosine phosphatase
MMPAAHDPPGSRPPGREPPSLQTSTSHPLDVTWVPIEGQAERLGLSQAPGRWGEGRNARYQRDLPTDLARLGELGISVLVPLLEAHEFKALRLEAYMAEAKRANMDVIWFPLGPEERPQDLRKMEAIARQVLTHIRAGRSVLIHDHSGQSRAGLLASCVLLHTGLTPREVARIVRHARRGALASHEPFLDRYAAHLAGTPTP